MLNREILQGMQHLREWRSRIPVKDQQALRLIDTCYRLSQEALRAYSAVDVAAREQHKDGMPFDYKKVERLDRKAFKAVKKVEAAWDKITANPTCVSLINRKRQVKP